MRSDVKDAPNLRRSAKEIIVFRHEKLHYK